MNQIDFSISIAHLYPDLLNIYGDLGNIITLKNRCLWRGIEVKIEEIKAGYRVNPDEFDLYFIGGGQDGQQIMASKELLKNKERLQIAAQSDAVFLGICGGYQLMGHYYKPHEGEELQGIGILDAYTVAGNKRFIGNVSGICPHIENKTLAGFENHSGLTYLQGETKPLMKVLKGYGNNGKDKTEGARLKNVFGTYLHGPVLPKNPVFADYLISLALKRKYKCEIPLFELNDEIEEKAHEACLKLAR
ncbi:MAG: glutamine amidotransferase [bacterium]|nr:glutamine amidotransferase [bacterium]